MVDSFEELFQKPISRINVVGTSGSGKSTFAKKLANALGYPYIQMDQLFWGPNWTYKNDDEFFRSLEEALDQENWVLDGNYGRTTRIKWEKVDVVVWLDYSFIRTLYQVTKRAIQRAWTLEELWEGTGNRESFKRGFFSKDSIIWWSITTHGRMRKRRGFWRRCEDVARPSDYVANRGFVCAVGHSPLMVMRVVLIRRAKGVAGEGDKFDEPVPRADQGSFPAASTKTTGK